MRFYEVTNVIVLSAQKSSSREFDAEDLIKHRRHEKNYLQRETLIEFHKNAIVRHDKPLTVIREGTE